ncbi:MAG TPA: protein translocase subunit SecD [Burkholderiales bacterium]|jgi:preprotein translocase subunit SecD|nr:protein translocase subunit SecD [Burkholderiales bacterium]
MNRYPLWKYLVISAALVLGAIYALPNFFGESPAVQISAAKATAKIDESLLRRAEEVLRKSNIVPEASFFDPTGVKLRFANTDTQLRAKDVLQSELGEAYVIALNLLSNSPRWLANINALPMYLGLDLRGGVHFLLQVDMQGALTKAADRYAQDVRQVLRSKDVRYGGIQREGQGVVVRFRDVAMRDQALTLLEREVPDLALRAEGTDAEPRLVGTLKPEVQKRIQEFALQQNITTLRNRVNELGVAEPIVQQSGADRVVVQLPGVQDTAKAKEILGRTASLEVRLVDEDKMDPVTLQAAIGGQIPLGTDLLYDREGTPYLLKKEVILTGDRISDAQPGFDGQTGEPAVHLTLDGRGATLFQQATRENVGRRIAMVLIEKGRGEVVTAPVVRQEIGGGRVQISGRMTTTEARDVALLLRAGALAAPMEIVEERTVGPSLGADNIRRGFHSTWIGFAALSIFIIVYYSVFGVISVIALGVNLMLLVALLSLLQATLTLPGIAAIALTLGMAIDANVLINERIREELRNGTTPQAAIAAGYERAWATILDSNITTLIAGIALFLFGTGPVRGFAVVHCLGILTSMFSAVFVSRGIVNYVYGSRRKLERLPIGNTDWHKRQQPV